MRLKVLDCTLRDGGYCNSWRFGKNNIKRIISDLVNARIDVVECGFITNKVEYDSDTTKFTKVGQIEELLPKTDVTQKFVAMINYGEYQAEMLPKCEETRLDGIRVAFHKKNREEALELCKGIKEKGYQVFLQPMVAVSYSDEEYIDLIKKANELQPYAFYLVDSFGTMRRKDVVHYLGLVEEYLDSNIEIGFHSHNNYQSAFSNALCFIEEGKNRDIIVDSSIYGMGRGAGNLNTELFLKHINDEWGTEYIIKPLIKCMDEVINSFYEKKPWGYSLPNYLSASHLAHPNYAIYLSQKNTLTLDAMDDIFSLMENDKLLEFDANYAEELYIQYMSRSRINDGHIEEFLCEIKNRKVLLVAPGKSVAVKAKEIAEFCEKEEPIVIGINHEYKEVPNDYIFVSNLRRYGQISDSVKVKLLTTSNILVNKAFARFDYFSLINSSVSVKDNAGLMLIRLLMNSGVKEVYLAGFDGYVYSAKNNYENSEMILRMDEKQIDILNKGVKAVLDEYRESIQVHFITKSLYE